WKGCGPSSDSGVPADSRAWVIILGVRDEGRHSLADSARAVNSDERVIIPSMLYDDTIAAIATPPGEGGIGIVRVSGEHALAILERIFAAARRGAWRPFHMRLGRV